MTEQLLLRPPTTAAQAMSQTVASANRLPLRSPHRIFGAFQVAYAFLVAGLIAAALPQLRAIAAGLPALFESKTAPDAVTVVTLAMQAFGLLCGAFIVLTHFLGGLRRLLSFFVPVGVPADLHASVATAEWLFVRRTIGLFAERSALIRRAMSLLSPRLEYLTPPAERLLAALLAKGPLISCLLLFVATWLMRPNLSLPWGVLTIVVLAKVLYGIALATVVPEPPAVEVEEVREHLARTSNPMNFFLHLDRRVQELRFQTFPNRLYVRNEPAIVGVAPGITSTFNGALLAETQPLPLPHWRPKGAQLLAGAGVLLGTGAVALLLHVAPRLPATGGVGSRLHCLLIAFTALGCSSALLAHALSLFQVFRFRSLLLSIGLQGTYTSSAIGLGDGRGGQFFSERRSLQSDTSLVTYAASIVTECHGSNALRATRYLIATTTDSEHRAAFARLLDEIRSFNDSTTHLPEIALERPAVQQLVQANLQIAANTARAAAAGALPPPLPGQPQQQLTADEAPTPVPVGGDWKTCPECGEQIRAAARKCRFCNFRLDEQNTTA